MKTYNRYLTPDNRTEPGLVHASGYVKGGDARTLAGGRRVKAYPGPHPPSRDTYDFETFVSPKMAYGFDLSGNRVVREVYWQEGMTGVIDFPVEDRVGIRATVTRDPLP